MDGVALLTARRVKERRYPEFVWRAGASSIGRPCCGSWGQVLDRARQDWPRFGHGVKHHSWRGVLSNGECDGLGCSGARLQKLWLHPFWRCKDALALMGLLQRGTRWKGTSVMPAFAAWASVVRLGADSSKLGWWSISSKTTFIKNHFHQKPLSSKPLSSEPLGSKTTFIKNHFHQKPLSPKTTFIKNPKPQRPKPNRPEP